MAWEVLRIGVVGICHPSSDRWAERSVRPAAVMADLPPLQAGSILSNADGMQTVYLGDFALMLHSGETGHYIDNLRAARPSVWVAMEAGAVQMVTIDPYEGEALASDPERLVEALAMPQPVAARLAAFIEAHHVNEVFYKRKRTPAAPDGDRRAPRVLGEDDKWVRSRGRAGRPGGPQR